MEKMIKIDTKVSVDEYINVSMKGWLLFLI